MKDFHFQSIEYHKFYLPHKYDWPKIPTISFNRNQVTRQLSLSNTYTYNCPSCFSGKKKKKIFLYHIRKECDDSLVYLYRPLVPQHTIKYIYAFMSAYLLTLYHMYLYIRTLSMLFLSNADEKWGNYVCNTIRVYWSTFMYTYI